METQAVRVTGVWGLSQEPSGETIAGGTNLSSVITPTPGRTPNGTGIISRVLRLWTLILGIPYINFLKIDPPFSLH